MTTIKPNQDRPVTVADITRKLKEYFVMADEGIVELVLATFISNRLSTVEAPVWLLLVAESSGGKTELIDMFQHLARDQYKLAYNISDLSPQTFISGMQNSGQETSLLHKINGRMVFIKDFTTILQKNKEARKEILAQFREIYDGEFNKDFGTGKSVHWKGRLGVIAGLTPPALEIMTMYGGMGERFIAYSMKQPTNKELAKAMKDNYSKDVRAIKDELADMVAQYVSRMVAIAERTDRTEQQLSDELFDELNDVAIFATGARSQMNVDMRTREPVGLPSKERFPRFVKQLQSLAKAFYVMNAEKGLSSVQKNVLYKIALDSVPRLRRAILQLMTKHKTVNTSSVAARFGFTTPVMRGELAQLSSLQIIQRIPGGGRGNEDAWKLIHRHRVFMSKFDKIKMQDDDLFEEDDVSPFDGADVGEEDDEKTQQAKMASLQAGAKEAFVGVFMQQNPSLTMEQAEEEWDKQQNTKEEKKHMTPEIDPATGELVGKNGKPWNEDNPEHPDYF